MTHPPDFGTVRGYERLGRVTLLVAAVLSITVAVIFPARRLLVAYALYAIPAHLLISFLPNEPMLLYVAKSSAPASVATAGTLGAIAAAILDYWLIGWFVNSGLVRSRLDGSRIYRVASRIFLKAPFLLIAGSALAPVPFYPVKILAIAGGYSLAWFIAAVVAGRWPRFYLLAIGGRTFQAPNGWLLGAAVVLEVLTIFGIWQTRRRNRESRSQ